MNTANPEQNVQDTQAATVANNGPVSMNQYIAGQLHRAVDNSQPLAEPKKLSDEEKETIIKEAILFIIPSHGMIAGIRYIADTLVESPAAILALNERFAVLNYSAGANPFVLDVLKLAVSTNPEASEAFELYDVWDKLTTFYTDRETAFKRFQANVQEQRTLFLGANMGMLSH